MSGWMFNCKEVTRLVSESLDRELPFHQRVGLWIHLLMCRFCSRYRSQLLILRKTIRFYVAQEEDREPSITLPPEARERIKRSLSLK